MQSEEMDSKSITFYHFAFHLYHSTFIKMNNEEFTLISDNISMKETNQTMGPQTAIKPISEVRTVKTK
jgi:hypothetical protein